MSKGNTKIPQLVEKAFLQIIEKRNKDRDDILLKDICDCNTELFGERGSETRRDLQQYWKNCKRRNTYSYIALLDRLKITPGKSTTRQLQDERKATITCL